MFQQLKDDFNCRLKKENNCNKKIGIFKKISIKILVAFDNK